MSGEDKLSYLYERLLAKYSFYENLLNAEYEAIANERMEELEVLLGRKQQYLDFLANIWSEIAEAEAKLDLLKNRETESLQRETTVKLYELGILQNRNKDELSRRLGALSDQLSQHHITRTRVAAYRAIK